MITTAKEQRINTAAEKEPTTRGQSRFNESANIKQVLILNIFLKNSRDMTLTATSITTDLI